MGEVTQRSGRVRVRVRVGAASNGGERAAGDEMRNEQGGEAWRHSCIGRCRQASIRQGRRAGQGRAGTTERTSERAGKRGRRGSVIAIAMTKSNDQVHGHVLDRVPPSSLVRVLALVPPRHKSPAGPPSPRQPVPRSSRIQGSKVAARARCRHVTTSATASNSSRAVFCLSVVTASPSPSPASSRRDSWAPSPVRSTPPELPRDCTAEYPLRRLVVSVAAGERAGREKRHLASRLAAPART
jgi:hypothetical protein